jgi:hypothetical protein
MPTSRARRRGIATAAIRTAFGFGAAALMIANATGCSSTSTTEEAPTTATTPASATSAPAVSPTEKAVGPGGDNSFSPTINPTPPGAVCKEVVGGVCIR